MILKAEVEIRKERISKQGDRSKGNIQTDTERKKGKHTKECKRLVEYK